MSSYQHHLTFVCKSIEDAKDCAVQFDRHAFGVANIIKATHSLDKSLPVAYHAELLAHVRNIREDMAEARRFIDHLNLCFVNAEARVCDLERRLEAAVYGKEPVPTERPKKTEQEKEADARLAAFRRLEGQL